MQAPSIRRLLKLHRWCGLVVSLNLALFSLTGVLLMFHEQIDAALGVLPEVEQKGERISLRRAVALARENKPNAAPLYVFADDEEYPGLLFVGMGEGTKRIQESKAVTIDAHQGRVLTKLDLESSFSSIVLRLHAQLLLGPGGSLLVGFVGLCLLITLVTGALVYGPMMRRFAFGTLRRERQLRTWLADLHKLIGVATFGWNLVVTVTGILLSLGSLAIQYYAMTELAALAGAHAQAALVEDYSQLDSAVVRAEQMSGRRWSMVALPGSDLASPRDYTVLLRGGEGLDARMVTLAMIDALTPSQAVHRELPWYLRALLISEPLHFGDYGGMPLKILWVLFSLASLALAGSGVWSLLAGKRARSDEPLMASLAPEASR